MTILTKLHNRTSTRLLLKCIAYISDKNVRNLAPRLEIFRNKYIGNRCFIMGNGPSINLMNLNLLHPEYVWATNRAYLLFPQVQWRPSFYTAVDVRVVPDISTEIKKISNELPDTCFFFPVGFREKCILQSKENIYWFNELPLDENNLPNGMFTNNASKWVASARTVTISAIQLAVFLGFNPIYLIGCDTSYSVPNSVILENGNSDLYISTQDDDENHFIPNYFGKGSKWHNPHVDRMIFHYEQTKIFCDGIGVNIYNATVGGRLEIFPRVSFETLFE